MTHVRTAAYYPQSNGKIERFHKTIKGDAIRIRTLLRCDDARNVITDFVAYYHGVRLHGALGCITPNDMLAGKKRRFTRNATVGSRALARSAP